MPGKRTVLLELCADAELSDIMTLLRAELSVVVMHMPAMRQIRAEEELPQPPPVVMLLHRSCLQGTMPQTADQLSL